MPLRRFVFPALVLATGLPAFAQVPHSVAVLPVDAQRAFLDPSSKAALDEGIRTSTVDSVRPLGFRVAAPDATRAAIEASTPSLTQPQQTCEGPCAQEAARRLGVQYVVSTTTTSSEGQYTAFVSIADVGEGNQVGALELNAPSVRELREQFAQKAPAFFARTLGQGAPPVAQQQPAPVQPQQAPAQPQEEKPTIIVRPVPEQRPALPAAGVRFAPLEHDRSYAISVDRGPAGHFDCGHGVSWLQPCSLPDVPAGPARVRVQDGASFTQDVQVPASGATFQVWHKPYELVYAGGVAVAMGGVLLATPSAFLDKNSTSAPFYVAGAALGFAGLTLIAADLLTPHDGLRLAPPGTSEKEGTSPHLSGLDVGPTHGGAQLQMTGRF